MNEKNMRTRLCIFALQAVLCTGCFERSPVPLPKDSEVKEMTAQMHECKLGSAHKQVSGLPRTAPGLPPDAQIEKMRVTLFDTSSTRTIVQFRNKEKLPEFELRPEYMPRIMELLRGAQPFKGDFHPFLPGNYMAKLKITSTKRSTIELWVYYGFKGSTIFSFDRVEFFEADPGSVNGMGLDGGALIGGVIWEAYLEMQKKKKALKCGGAQELAHTSTCREASA